MKRWMMMKGKWWKGGRGSWRCGKWRAGEKKEEICFVVGVNIMFIIIYSLSSLLLLLV